MTTNQPLYDTDLVNKGYVDNALKNVNENIDEVNSRATKNFGSQPIPPYYINDTYMDGNNIYICKNTRLIGEFNSDDWDFASNYTDDTLAESRAVVFNTTPTPPYKLGDLWTDGPNGELRRCVYTRTNGSYSESDWENATKYDSTETKVENGLVTTGTIQVVQGGTVAAGMTGNDSGDDAIRFWAGSTLSNRATAPFRITQAGKVTASNINITGGSLTWNNLNKPTKNDLGTWTTYINDSGIYTGTLTASQVNAVEISADSIKSGTLTGRTISGSTITGSTIYTGSSSSGWILTSNYLKSRDNGDTTISSNGNIGLYGNHRIIAAGAVTLNSQQGRGIIVGDGMINPTDGLVKIYASSSSYIHLQSGNGIRINGPISVATTENGTRTNTYTGNPYYNYGSNTYKLIVINGLICGSERV